MVDNRSLEKKLLALSHGEEVEFTDEEKHQIHLADELENDEVSSVDQDSQKSS